MPNSSLICWRTVSSAPASCPIPLTQELRALLRTRKQLVCEATSHIQRVQKTLEDANIKLDSVISDVMGESGQAMNKAMIAGETNSTKLAGFADRRLKASPAQLRVALPGSVTEPHRFPLRLHLNQIDALESAIAEIGQQVEAAIAPFRAVG
jgi:transposase